MGAPDSCTPPPPIMFHAVRVQLQQKISHGEELQILSKCEVCSEPLTCYRSSEKGVVMQYEIKSKELVVLLLMES